MSGLWDWWRRVRGEEKEDGGGLEEEEGEVGVRREGIEEEGKGGEVGEEDSEEEEKEYAEIEDLVKEDTASSENDYDEVAELPRESERPDGEEAKEEGEEEWSEDEEWERAFNDCLVPTVVLSLGLAGELGQLGAAGAARAVLQPPLRLHSATARLAPVYASVSKHRVLPPNPPPVTRPSPPPDQQLNSPPPPEHQRNSPPPPEGDHQLNIPPPPDHQRNSPPPPDHQLNCPPPPERDHQRNSPPPPDHQRNSPPHPDNQRNSPPPPDNQRNSPPPPDHQRNSPPPPDHQRNSPPLPERDHQRDSLPPLDRTPVRREDDLPLPGTAHLRQEGSLPPPDGGHATNGLSPPPPDEDSDGSEDGGVPGESPERVPPPLPAPDWEEDGPQPWRPGRLRKMKKWIGAAPNRISRILSQDYLCHQGQSGFEDLRRYIKQGGDFCKELTAILQERSEAEAQFGKTLGKLSSKLTKATKEGQGTVNAAWHRVAAEMEAQAEVHRNFATALAEEVVRPLKQLVDSQHRIRKSVETAVDKSGKNLSEWRAAECKAKKTSFTCARENEKLREGGTARLNSSALHLPPRATPEKETAKMETKRRKAEECVKKADVEYYSVCLRAERSRLEWESAVLRGSHCFQVLEEERLKGLKDLASSYLSNFTHIGPKITQISDRLSEPVKACDLSKDLETVISLKAATEPSQEQILPDFYPEHTTLAMNRERRKMALVKLLELIRSDLERERRGKAGVENLAVALRRTPTFASEDSHQNVQDKLHHMRSMLTYLEAARYKILCVLSELEGRARPSHPLAEHIHVSRDRQGYQHSVLKVPSWIHTEMEATEWVDRGTADGTSAQPDSDFDEFSSQGSEKDYEPVVSITSNGPTRCRALYNYTANLYDELSLNPGDIINIHDKQPDGWWLGELNGVVGIFPATYVEEIK